MDGHLTYAFGPLREHSSYPHLKPESPNSLLRTWGHKEVLQAHDWSSLPLTTEREPLNARQHIIKRQMGHLISEGSNSQMTNDK